MKEIKLKNNRVIGENEKPYLIGEIGINHNGDIDIAKKLIDMASHIGIDAIKFQKRDYKKTITKKQLSSPYINHNSFGKTYELHKKALEFSGDQLVELSAYANEKNLDFSCSAFDIDSFDFIENMLNPPFHKIPSPLTVNHELLEHVAEYGKPIFLSTGMTTYKEVKVAVDIIKPINKNLVLLQCTSLYPTENEEVNLKVIMQYKEDFDVLVGFSSHDRSVVFPTVAVAFGACVFEKHITLDRTMRGPDHSSSFEKRGLDLCYNYLLAAHKALGNHKKEIQTREIKSREKHMQSIVSACCIKAGTIIEKKHLMFKAPGIGFMPYEIEKVIGKIAVIDIAKDEILKIDDIK